MKIGALLQPMHSLEMSRVALQRLQQENIDSIWLPDHLLGLIPPSLWHKIPASAAIPDPDSWLDPFCVIASLGESTNLPMGTCVTDSTRRRGADLARTAITLNESCRGGFILGIGAGEAESVLPFGYNFERPLGSLEQALIEIRSLFDTGKMPSGCGRTGFDVRADGAAPKVWVASHGPRSLELTGRYGDGWLPTTPSATQYAEQWETVRAASASAERPAPTAGLCSVMVFGPSREEVLARLEAEPLGKVLMLFQPASVWDAYGVEHPAGPLTRGWIDTVPHALDPTLVRDALSKLSIDAVDERLLVGNASEIAERLRPFIDVGLQCLVVCDITGLVYPPQEADLQLGQLKKLCDLLRSQQTTTSTAITPRTVEG